MLNQLNVHALPFYPSHSYISYFEEESLEFPLTEEDIREMDEMDAVNEVLAELDVMETHQELYYKLQKKINDLQNSPISEQFHSLLSMKQKEQKVSRAHRTSQKHFHGKKGVFSMKQPR